MADIHGKGLRINLDVLDGTGISMPSRERFKIREQLLLMHWIRSLAFTPDGSQLATSATDGMHVWDPVSGKITESYSVNAGPRSLATLDPKGPTLISGEQDGTISAWNSTAVATAVKVVDNSAAGAVYKGLASNPTGSTPMLYAANFFTGSMMWAKWAMAPVRR